MREAKQDAVVVGKISRPRWYDTSFGTSADKLQNHYTDQSQRLRKRELDPVTVVNMFLTGLEATTLKTL